VGIPDDGESYIEGPLTANPYVARSAPMADWTVPPQPQPQPRWAMLQTKQAAFLVCGRIVAAQPTCTGCKKGRLKRDAGRSWRSRREN